MTIREVIKEAWFDLTGGQRVVVTVITLVLAIVMLSGWISSLRAEYRVRQAESTANRALKKAADIAAEILKREKALAKIEEKRDEKQKELDAVAANTNSDRAEYDRAVREPRTDNVSAEQLCAELADLGYPCYR